MRRVDRKVGLALNKRTSIEVAIASLRVIRGNVKSSSLIPDFADVKRKIVSYHHVVSLAPQEARLAVAMASLDRMESVLTMEFPSAPSEEVLRSRRGIAKYIEGMASAFGFDVRVRTNIGVWPFNIRDRRFYSGTRTGYMSTSFDVRRMKVVIDVPSFTRLYAGYNDLILICKHEVAHVMSWPAFDNGGHGPAFERAMSMLGASGFPTSVSNLKAGMTHIIGCKSCGRSWHSNGSSDYDECSHCGSYDVVKIKLGRADRRDLSKDYIHRCAN